MGYSPTTDVGKIDSLSACGVGVRRKSVQEMGGEFLREAGVLVLVFGFLDLFMTEKPITFWFAVSVFSISGFFLVTGMLAEVSRRE
jgi:hypothetical protein